MVFEKNFSKMQISIYFPEKGPDPSFQLNDLKE